VGNNIKVDLQDIGLEVVDCVHLVQDKDQWWVFVNTVLQSVPLANEPGISLIILPLMRILQ